MAKTTKKKFKDTKVGKALGSIFKAPANKKLNLNANVGSSLQQSTPAPNLNKVISGAKNVVKNLTTNVKTAPVPSLGGNTNYGMTVAPKGKTVSKSGGSKGGIIQYADSPMSVAPNQTIAPNMTVAPRTASGGYVSGNRVSSSSSKSSDPTATYFETFGAQNEPSYQSSPAITNRDVTSPTPGLPTTNVTGTTDFNAILNGGLAGIYNYDQTTQESTDKDITAIFKDLMKAQPDNAEIYNDALKQSGKEEAQKLVAEKTAQLGAITSKAQADQLSLVGQGRGIPEAIIGGQQAQIAREAAIRALPISAELAAAQGNLEMATENLNTLYKIKSDDAANKYAFKVKVADYAIQFATKSQANKINFLKDAYKEQQDAEQENIAQLHKIALELASKGKSSAFLSKIDPKDSNAVFNAIQMAGTALQDVKAGSGSSSSSYTVVQGDEPSFIASKLGLTEEALLQLNPGVNWYNLQPGQKLNINTKDLQSSDKSTDYIGLTPAKTFELQQQGVDVEAYSKDAEYRAFINSQLEE